MIVIDNIGLIGDFLGSIPVIIELAKRNPNNLSVYFNQSMHDIVEMIPKKYNINILSEEPSSYDYKLDISAAFQYAAIHKLHMTQTYFHQCKLETPPGPVKPELEVMEFDIYTSNIDYILAPFSRSLPNNQRWPKENWTHLTNAMPDKNFLLLGNSNHDDINFIQTPNTKTMFDRPLNEVAYIMKNSKAKLLSVVTGISHLSYALDVPTILFWNQGEIKNWGDNPDAKHLTKYIPDITIQEIILALK